MGQNSIVLAMASFKSFRPRLTLGAFLAWHDLIRGEGIMDKYRSLLESQFFTREELEGLQIRYLKKLLSDALDNVPYYREIKKNLQLEIPKINSLGALSSFPILTKDILRERNKDLVNVSLPKSRFMANSTSGSTGAATHFYTDRASLPMYGALHMRQHQWMGTDYFVRQLWIWGSSFIVKRNWSTRLRETIKNKKLISSYHLSETDVGEIVKEIDRFKPGLIGAYPSHLSYIGEHATRPLKHRPLAISLSGEMLYPEQLQRIKDYFGSAVFEYYGARDGSLIAQECKCHNGLHLFSENVIVEILDDNDQPVTDGTGRVVLTLLHNYAMPLIRYEIGDLAEIDSSMWAKCGCGITLPRLRKVQGRSFDLVTFPNGNKVGGTFWTFVMKSVPGIITFNIHQNFKGDVTILYVPQSGSYPDTEAIRAKLLQFGGADINVSFVKVNSLENRTKTGKLQFVSSDYKP